MPQLKISAYVDFFFIIGLFFYTVQAVIEAESYYKADDRITSKESSDSYFWNFLMFFSIKKLSDRVNNISIFKKLKR